MDNVKAAVWRMCGTDWQCYIDWADHWQTMITGIVAVCVAFLAAVLAYAQLKASSNGEADRRTRTLRAARASLPVVLTAICNHASSIAKRLDEAWPHRLSSFHEEYDPAHVTTYKMDVPRFPEELIRPLQDVLQLVDDEAVIERISSIFREAQVLDARSRPLATGVLMDSFALADMILQAVALYARAESLFDFARGHSTCVSDLSLQALQLNALETLGILNTEALVIAREEYENGSPIGEGDSRLPPRTAPAEGHIDV